MTARQPLTVVLDPSKELVTGLGVKGRIEDWLLYVDPDTDEDDVAASAGARAAGDIALALTEAARDAPRPYTPDGRTELTSLVVIFGDLGAGVAALGRGLEALPDPRRFA